ncbi:hypothetical protein COO60DRAFT_1504361, partial [Scenedesmus sp. NREL 46B-D3]
ALLAAVWVHGCYCSVCRSFVPAHVVYDSHRFCNFGMCIVPASMPWSTVAITLLAAQGSEVYVVLRGCSVAPYSVSTVQSDPFRCQQVCLLMAFGCRLVPETRACIVLVSG